MLQGMELTVTNRSQAYPEERVYKKEERLKNSIAVLKVCSYNKHI